MSEPKTWIDVADTAITIGLAALVGGGFSVLLSALNHRREAKKEYFKRRRELLEKILEDFDRFAEAQSVHWAKLANAVETPPEPLEARRRAETEAKEAETVHWESYRCLLPCRSRLLLLGECHCEAQLTAFRARSDEFFQIATLSHPNCTKEKLAAHKTALSAARTQFYNSLFQAHSKSV